MTFNKHEANLKAQLAEIDKKIQEMEDDPHSDPLMLIILKRQRNSIQQSIYAIQSTSNEVLDDEKNNPYYIPTEPRKPDEQS